MLEKANAKSIILLGARGVGKSTITKRLSVVLDMPIVHFDDLIYLPNDISTVPSDLDDSQLATYVRRMRSRSILPNLPNAYQLGYSEQCEKKIFDICGEQGVMFYKKYFESQIFSTMINNLERSVIIDTSSDGILNPIATYAPVIKKLQNTDINLYKKCFRHHYTIDDALLYNAISSLGRVVFVKNENPKISNKLDINSLPYHSLISQVVDSSLFCPYGIMDTAQVDMAVAQIIDGNNISATRDGSRQSNTKPTHTSNFLRHF